MYNLVNKKIVFVMVALLIGLTGMPFVVQSENDDFVDHSCSGNLYYKDDGFAGNLAHLMGELETVTPGQDGKRYTTNVEDPDIQGTATCALIIDRPECAHCLSTAKPLLFSYCANNDGGYIKLVACTLQYGMDTIELVKELREPTPMSQDLELSSKFAQNSWGQYVACLWKQHLSYWRNPQYNSTRFTFMIVVAVLFGAVFWQKGQKLKNEQDLFNMLGLMFISVIFLGINNCTAIIPFVSVERNVLYRERFAAMYSSWAYALAQVTIEVPYVLLQAILFVAITYPSIDYQWSAYKFSWYMYATFCTFLYFVYLGMLLVSLTPNVLVATVLSVAFYTLLSLFSGFLMPGPKIPGWWIWLYRICPTSWSLYGLLSSQYGDLDKIIEIFGEPKSVSSFLEDFFGFRHNYLGLVAFILIAFPIFFAISFAYCIATLNFLRR